MTDTKTVPCEPTEAQRLLEYLAAYDQMPAHQRRKTWADFELEAAWPTNLRLFQTWLAKASRAALAAAPAHQPDPRLAEWGYSSLDEALTHLGQLLEGHQPDRQGAGEPVAWLYVETRKPSGAPCDRKRVSLHRQNIDPEDRALLGVTEHALTYAAPPPPADTAMREAVETALRSLRSIPAPQVNDGTVVAYSVSDDVPEVIFTAISWLEEALTLSRRDAAEGRG